MAAFHGAGEERRLRHVESVNNSEIAEVVACGFYWPMWSIFRKQGRFKTFSYPSACCPLASYIWAAAYFLLILATYRLCILYLGIFLELSEFYWGIFGLNTMISVIHDGQRQQNLWHKRPSDLRSEAITTIRIGDRMAFCARGYVDFLAWWLRI
jgi:hypothetical protein